MNLFRFAVSAAVAFSVLTGCGTSSSQSTPTSTTAPCKNEPSPLHAALRKEHLHSGYAPAGFLLMDGDENALVPTMQEFRRPGNSVDMRYLVMRNFTDEKPQGRPIKINGIDATLGNTGMVANDHTSHGTKITWRPQPDVMITVDGLNISQNEVVKIAEGIAYTRSDYPPSTPAGCTPSGRPRVSGVLSRDEVLAKQPVIEGTVLTSTREHPLVRGA